MRGQAAPVGSERVSQNGYTYVKTKDGWVLKHWIIAEEKYSRKVDRDVTVRFADEDRTNFDPDNIVLTPKRGKGRADILRKRIREYRERIRELEAELNAID